MDEYKDELNLDMQDDRPIEDRRDKRIEDLLTKVKTASQEKEEALKARQEAETARQNLEKERDFFASFSDQLSKYPAAAEYKEAIKEKVLAGYTPEDATIAVLNAQGKFTPAPPPPPPPPAPVAGGSATNLMSELGNKTASEMTQQERLSALLEAEKRGDIFIS